MSYVLPNPPLVDGKVLLAAEIHGQTVDGALGECIACGGTCWGWWSDRPPSGYVALHPTLECAQRLRVLWQNALRDGEVGGPEAPPVVTGRHNAYARRRGGAISTRVSAPVPVKHAIELPPDFVPGPFWKPGYGHLVPWVLLSQTASGHMFTPFGEDRQTGLRRLREQRMRRVVLHNVPVVGAALIGPDGTVTDSWGDPPTPGRSRWRPILRIPEWRRCLGCDTARWPGTWMSAHGALCRACLEPGEVDDPRPWPPDPTFPGLGTAPFWMGGPKPAKTRQREKIS
jgi:hypothetical protein